MIIKVQDDNFNDRFLVEAAYIRWDFNNDDYAVMEIHIVAEHTQKTGSIAVTTPAIEEHPSLRLRICHGDRVFVMNNEGKTIDSKRIELNEEDAKKRRRKERDRKRGYDPEKL